MATASASPATSAYRRTPDLRRIKTTDLANQTSTDDDSFSPSPHPRIDPANPTTRPESPIRARSAQVDADGPRTPSHSPPPADGTLPYSIPPVAGLPPLDSYSPPNQRPRHPVTTSSPTLSRRHSPLLPSFGSGFKATSRLPFGPPSKRLVPRLFQSRNPQRNRLLGLAAAAVLVLWVLLSRRGDRVVKERLTTRWWDPLQTGKPPNLLPRPSMIPKPPLPKPLTISSHSLHQLARLTSSFSPTSPPEWTAVVHLSSSSQLATLAKLITSILRQSIPPSRVLILAPDGLSPNLKNLGPSVALLSYPTSRPAALAIVLATGSVATEFILVVDGDLEVIKSSYVRTLLRASGTKEYRNALLSGGGLVLPVSSSSRLTTCLVSDGAPDALDHTAAIHAPSTPFLVQTSWLSPLSNGLRTDLPLEVGLALALWTKEGIPSFGLPVPWDEGHRDWGCERLKRSVIGSESRLGPLFRREVVFSGTSDDGTSAPITTKKEGTVIILLSGDEELELAHTLACGFAQEHDVRVYVADSESSAQGPQVFFVTADTPSGGTRCHLDVHPLGKGAAGESVQLLVVEEFEKVPKIEAVLYAVDGPRGREFGEVLKWSEAVFGVRMGGQRRGRRKVDQEGGTVVIPLLKADIAQSEWIAALPIDALRHWHTPKIDVAVITNNRPVSLNRLLESLQDAHYFGDEMSLSLNLEQTADRATQRLVDDYTWPFGPVTLRHRIVLGGLMPAIVESWYPASNDSYGVFLEDDVEVSPMFYAWLKFTILYYRYYPPMQERSQRLFGVSLYQQRNIELRPEGRQPFDAHKLFASLSMPATLPYLSQIPCSWGAVYFPEVWREFHAYLALRLSETAMSISDSIVPEIKSNKWARSWKKYFIELVYMRGYVMLYPNYADFTSFSNNHLEKGNHVSEVDLKRKRQFDVPLMARNQSILDLPDGRLPVWDALPVMDLWGAVATDEDLVERGWQSVTQLDTCPPFRLDVLPTYNARELLCAKVYTRTNVLIEAQPLAREPARRREDVAGVVVRPPLVDHPDREGLGKEQVRGVEAPDGLERAEGGQEIDLDVEGEDEWVEVVAEVPRGAEAYEVEQEEERLERGGAVVRR